MAFCTDFSKKRKEPMVTVRAYLSFRSWVVVLLCVLLSELVVKGSLVVPCVDRNEAYAGAWVASVDLLVQNHFFNDSNSMPVVSGEMASYFLLSNAMQETWDGIIHDGRSGAGFNKLKTASQAGGLAVQSADVLDFCAIHLSSVEQSGTHHGPAGASMDDRKAKRTNELHALLKPAIKSLRDETTTSSSTKDATHQVRSDTLVVIPYFAQKKWRMGESQLEHRPVYLQATYQSLVHHFGSSNIVVGVQNRADFEFVRSLGLSGTMPLKDVLKLHQTSAHMKNHQRSHTRLPVALIAEVVGLIKNKSDHYKAYKYVFYSEADMVFNIQPGLSKLMALVDTAPSMVLFPHRLMSYLPSYLAHHNKAAPAPEDELAGARGASSRHRCCSDLLNCTTKSHWVKFSAVPQIHSLYGIPVVLAASHESYRGGSFRLCSLFSRDGDSSSSTSCPGL
jgi:hypothetical protein